MARRRKKLPTEPVEAVIESMSHDGRGVTRVDDKTVFVHGALPGETVRFVYTDRYRKYDEARVDEVLNASPLRVEPPCEYFGTCGGCALQHMQPEAQIDFKQKTLLDNLERIGKVTPDTVYDSLTGPLWNYRRKARLSVRYVTKKERVLVGFRERYGRFVADCQSCPVLVEPFSGLLESFGELIGRLSGYNRIPQIEVAAGDEHAAIVVRHLDPLSDNDREHLKEFGQAHNIGIYLQPKGPDTIAPLYIPFDELSYSLPAHDLRYPFRPDNFIQVNGALNRQIADQAIALLEPTREDTILDLFCGLGNFSLPLARYAGKVVGVEGDKALVEQARSNARLNDLGNATFLQMDLNEDSSNAPWRQPAYTKILLDPPRSGAQNVLPVLAKTSARTLLYISCHPASLARDAGILVHESGFRLVGAGVMDMFPHTAHVESIALFKR